MPDKIDGQGGEGDSRTSRSTGLAAHEVDAKCAVLRKHGMSEGALRNWKARFGAMTVSEARRLKALGNETAELKTLLAEQMLDLAAVKALV